MSDGSFDNLYSWAWAIGPSGTDSVPVRLLSPVAEKTPSTPSPWDRTGTEHCTYGHGHCTAPAAGAAQLHGTSDTVHTPQLRLSREGRPVATTPFVDTVRTTIQIHETFASSVAFSKSYYGLAWPHKPKGQKKTVPAGILRPGAATIDALERPSEHSKPNSIV
jgi:hypothetical protein